MLIPFCRTLSFAVRRAKNLVGFFFLAPVIGICALHPLRRFVFLLYTIHYISRRNILERKLSLMVKGQLEWRVLNKRIHVLDWCRHWTICGVTSRRMRIICFSFRVRRPKGKGSLNKLSRRVKWLCQ